MSITYPYSHEDVCDADSVADFLVVTDQSNWMVTLAIIMTSAWLIKHKRAVSLLEK